MIHSRPWLPGRHVRVFPAAEVESVGPEDDPRAAGLARDDVEAIWTAVVRLYRTGLHPAIALSLRRRGKVVLARAIGHLSGNAPGERGPLVPIRHDSRFNLFSASKSVTAMLVHLCAERGLVGLDAPVARWLPAFGKHGKHTITLRHVLAHRAGLPALRGPIDLALLSRPAEIVELLCDGRPAAPAGRRPTYQALAGGYLLGAVLQAATGRGLRELLAAEIAGPLGLTLSYGMPAERVGEVAHNTFTGAAPVPPASWMFQRALGVSVEDAVMLSNDPAFLTTVVPSGNVISSAGDTCRFFQALLDGGGGLFAPATVAAAVAPAGSRVELDTGIGLPIRHGAGFMLGGERLSLYGARTRRAFGHIGFSNVVAWADPDRQVAACLMTSGKPFITPGQLIWLNVARTISRRCS